MKKNQNSEQMMIVVDKNDRFLEQYVLRSKAHTGLGIRHRAFVCFLLNSENRILLQKRKHWLWDNLWDLSAISHTLHLSDHDESYDEGMARALKKEMGIEKVTTKKIGGFNYYAKHEKDDGCENEYCAIMFGKYDGLVKPNRKEVYEYKWVNFGKFIKDVKINPDLYTPWAKLTIETLENEGKILRLILGDQK